MLNKNTKIKVKNRNNGSVGYTLPDMNNLRRKFYPGEQKEVTFEELQKLSYIIASLLSVRKYAAPLGCYDCIDFLRMGQPNARARATAP